MAFCLVQIKLEVEKIHLKSKHFIINYRAVELIGYFGSDRLNKSHKDNNVSLSKGISHNQL